MDKEKVEETPTDSRSFRFALLVLGFFAMLAVGFLGGYLGANYQKEGTGGLGSIGQKTVQVNEESDVISVGEKVGPSVVSITGERATMNFFGQISKSESSGTGFIVSADGYVVTNKHVVAEGANYSVFTNEGKEYPAKVMAKDPYFDIAILKIEAKNLKPVEFGDSDSIKVGQRVIAIGNALGQFQNTLTTGVVSAIGRAIEAGDAAGEAEVLENLIQTDAAINPGNSGGPLLNIAGQVIGINTAVASGAEGIGFSIPVNAVRTAIRSVAEKGKITRPMIGVRYINITKEFAARNNLKVQSGALLYAENQEAVLPGSPAAKAGLRQDDIIIKINNEKIGQGKSLVGLITKYQPGEKISLTYLRGGKEKTIDLVLGESG